MNAVWTQPPGGWEHTRWTDVPDPTCGPDEVLVEIRAAALNPADGHLIEGRYPGGPPPPLIAGRDAAGVVLQGDAGGKWREGDSVVVLQSNTTDLARGTFCERQTFSADNVAPLPEGWSFAEGAALPLVALTAWQALVDQGELQPSPPAPLPQGEGQGVRVVAVTGASGGVGLAAVQLARGLEATVVAFSRSEEKRARLKGIGAQHVLAPNEEELKKQVVSAVGGGGVNLVVETVGGPSLKQSVHLLGPGGKVCVVGVAAGVEGVVPIPSLLFKQASVHGILVSGYPPYEAREAWSRVVEVFHKSGARPVIDSQFPITEYVSAFDRLRSGPFGKVVLRIKDDAG